MGARLYFCTGLLLLGLTGCTGSRSLTTAPMPAALEQVNQALRGEVVTVEMIDGRRYPYGEHVTLTPTEVYWRGRSGIDYRRPLAEVDRIIAEDPQRGLMTHAINGAFLGAAGAALAGTYVAIKGPGRWVPFGPYYGVRKWGKYTVAAGLVYGLARGAVAQQQQRDNPSEVRVYYQGPLETFLSTYDP